MAKTIELAIDVPSIVSKIAERYNLNLPSKIVMFHYDDSSDTLYVHFEYPAKSADSKFADKYGEIVLGLNEKGKIVNLTIMNAATYGQQQSTRWVSTSGLICQTGWTSLFFTMFN